ncbi:hypothetical protein [Mesorhizobium sp. M0040]|uniref:hypothetical protein n=1 Tax=Mesorhizobium sp. M0040 TaxID=2956855 RepID=UPI0033353D6A
MATSTAASSRLRPLAELAFALMQKGRSTRENFAMFLGETMQNSSSAYMRAMIETINKLEPRFGSALMAYALYAAAARISG